MTATEQTLQQTERFIGKVADKFPATEEPTVLTDIHFRVNQETGELVAFDDDDKEITRSVIEQWINNHEDRSEERHRPSASALQVKKKLLKGCLYSNLTLSYSKTRIRKT